MIADHKKHPGKRSKCESSTPHSGSWQLTFRREANATPGNSGAVNVSRNIPTQATGGLKLNCKANATSSNGGGGNPAAPPGQEQIDPQAVLSEVYTRLIPTEA